MVVSIAFSRNSDINAARFAEKVFKNMSISIQCFLLFFFMSIFCHFVALSNCDITVETKQLIIQIEQLTAEKCIKIVCVNIAPDTLNI